MLRHQLLVDDEATLFFVREGGEAVELYDLLSATAGLRSVSCFEALKRLERVAIK